MTSKRGQRLMLIGVFVVFFLPVVVALLLRSDPTLLGAVQTTNHGHLIDPPQEVVAQGLVPRPPARREMLSFRDHWSVVIIDDGSCLQACRDALYAGRQAHIAMNKDMERVHRFLLLTAPSELAVEPALRDGLVIADAPPAWLPTFLPPGRNAQPGEIYLVDPRGFLFMTYAAGFQPGHLIKDLKRVLKISRVG